MDPERGESCHIHCGGEESEVVANAETAAMRGAIDALPVTVKRSTKASSGKSSWALAARSRKLERSGRRDSHTSRVDRYISSCVGARPSVMRHETADVPKLFA